MNFNHLIERSELKRTCNALGHKECYYQPVGDGQTTAGNNYHVTMNCKNCGRRTEAFMSERQYKQHSSILEREISNV
ncbi:MAG TPA: hypothetical protein EYN67_08735 [Flavobacteriales bacterium]|nr:hypothetical protein [Flavobacteriales bacterium]